MNLSRITIATSLAVLAACADQQGAEVEQSLIVAQTDARPNIVLIVADDLGYSDIEPYGGEIETPNLAAMAAQGVRFSRFYATNACSPTRSMLMSGMDNHLAGIGSQGNAPNQQGQPGYEGYLNERVVALPRLLQDAGYHTYMAGKWHLGGPPDHVPSVRGFDRTFALLEGGGSYFSDMIGAFGAGSITYVENGLQVDGLPDDFYATHFYTDRMIENIASNIDDDRPFFAYLAYTSPHFPLHAPDSTRDKYAGRFDQGFDLLKRQRFAALKSQGLIPADAVMPMNNPESDQWDELTEAGQRVNARAMEVYAAMVDDLDQQIGRVFDYLRDQGEYENTVFIFMSDNGADPTSGQVGPTFARVAVQNRATPDIIGERGSWYAYGHNWAEASTAAFSLYKSESAEGGVRVPAIVHWPGVTTTAETNHSLTSVMDILPTVLEIAGHDHPGSSYNGREVLMPQGKSLVPIVNGSQETVRTENDYLGVEHWSSRALIQRDWKILGLYSGTEGRLDWELYNISVDPGETNNLADTNPQKLLEMISLWDEYVDTNGVVLAEPGVPGLMPGPDMVLSGGMGMGMGGAHPE